MSTDRKDFVEDIIQTALLDKGMDVRTIYGTWFSGDEVFFPEDEDVPPDHIGMEAMAMTGNDIDGGFGLWPMEGKPIERFFEQPIIDDGEDEE